ncbi:MAG: hypothetical protein HDKAJFGB_01362 [Anaerolineae bacterium]|nr:hypothetical protein [Anaerolineae bacterium]
MRITTEWYQARWVVFAVIALGIGLRLLAATQGHNFDVDSYLIVADIIERGGNVYAETMRYNYGPVWFHILSAIGKAASFFPTNQEIAFRYILAGLLSLVDVGIFFVLWKKASAAAAYLFFLNPISILITGYHSQFDNLAILVGLFAVIILGDNFDKGYDSRKLAGLLTLGLSLMIKHLLFAFPFWLAVKQKGIWERIAIIIIPTLVFLLSFAPYWQDGQEGIIYNVFLYRSWDNQFFFRLFIPEILSKFINAPMVWLYWLFIFAIVLRHRNAFNSLLLYTCVLVATSPALTNQYLAIVIPFISVNPNFFFLLYTMLGTYYLLISTDGLHIAALQSIFLLSAENYYAILVILLCCGFIWHVWHQEIIALTKRTLTGIEIWIGNEKPTNR